MSKTLHPHFFSFIHVRKIISKFRKTTRIGGGFILDLEEYEKINKIQGGSYTNEY